MKQTIDIDARDKQGDIRLQIEFDNPFADGGTWLRGSLHTHPGKMGEIEAICSKYMSKGMDFMAATEYNALTSPPPQSGDFIFIQGAEVFYPGQSDLLHIICLGIDRLPQVLDGRVEDVGRLVKEVEGMGGVCVLAHPTWSDFSMQELKALSVAGLKGMEISNKLCHQINGKERGEELWQLLLKEGVFLAAIGVDDAVDLQDDDVYAATWTGVMTKDHSSRGVLDAIRAGRTYASEGPVIHSIEVDVAGYVAVKCDPCRICHFRSSGYGLRSISADTDQGEFVLDLSVEGYRMRDWFSVCLESDGGRRAWSSAMRVKVQTGKR